MKVESVVWRHKESGEFLFVDETTTHTGHHVRWGFVKLLETATVVGFLPYRIRRDVGHVIEPVRVEVTRTIKILGEENHGV